MTQLLLGEVPQGSNTQTTLPRPVSHAQYTALLPTIWALISSSTSREQAPNELVVALVNHALKGSSGSAVKKDTVEFLGLLGLVRSRSMRILPPNAHFFLHVL